MFLSPRRFYLKPTSVFIILLSIFILTSRFIPSVSKQEDRFIHRGLSPLIATFSSLYEKAKSFVDHYFFLVHTAKENLWLKGELARLQLKNQQLESGSLELARLQSLFALPKSASWEGEVSRVIGVDPIGGAKSFLIDKGQDNGIQKGQPVIAPAGVVGMIVRTTQHDAQVLLLTDPAFSVAGEVRPSGARGILHGQAYSLEMNRNYGITRMEYLGVRDEVHEKDLVVSSGLDQVFPPGIAIGHVHKINSDARNLFIDAEILPEVDFSKLKEVLVMTKISRSS